jgi:hypothetical protein
MASLFVPLPLTCSRILSLETQSLADQSPCSLSSTPSSGMEHLWSRAVATGGNRWQMERPRKWLRQANSVAVGCDRLPRERHGKGAPPKKGRGSPPSLRKELQALRTRRPTGLGVLTLTRVAFRRQAAWRRARGASDGRGQRRGLDDQVKRRLRLRDAERMRRARDLERATCAGALGNEALEFGYGEVSSMLIRRSACCIPVSRAVGFGWAGRSSS